MCMAEWGERPEVYRAEIRRTRKQRRCEECRRTIEVGERYENAFMVYEGKGWTVYTCEHCMVGCSWLTINCGAFMHGEVWEDLEEHIKEYPAVAFALSKLKIARMRQWKRFDCTGLMTVPACPPEVHFPHKEYADD